MKTRTLLLLLALLLLMATVSANRRRGPRRRPQRNRQCIPLPRFSVNDVEPMTVANGQVTLVALLTSDCPFCISQSRTLQQMHTGLQAQNTPVHMMIINGGPRPAPGEEGIFEGIVSFPVYHDDNNRTIWGRVFNGSKDDIFILDRCGQVAYRIPFPYSYLGYNYVQRALRRTLTGNVCSNCSRVNMEGDVGGSANLGRSRGRSPALLRRARRSSGLPAYVERILNLSRCPRNDPMCQRLRRLRLQEHRSFRWDRRPQDWMSWPEGINRDHPPMI